MGTDSMWFEEDSKTVYTEMVRTDSGTEAEIVVRFLRYSIPYGDQEYGGKQGWFCAYVVMRDGDFARISGKLQYDCMGFPDINAPGGTTYFNKAPPFDGDRGNEGLTVIGWDYCYEEPYEKGVTLDSAVKDAKTAAAFLSDLLSQPSDTVFV